MIYRNLFEKVLQVGNASPHILLINPWITDFAAYNFWIRPIGLLYIASLLRENRFQITLVDCLDHYSKIKKSGMGIFLRHGLRSRNLSDPFRGFIVGTESPKDCFEKNWLL